MSIWLMRKTGELAALWSRYSCSGLFLEFLGVKNQVFHSSLGFFCICLSLFALTHGVKHSFNWTSIRLVPGSNSDSDTFVTLVNCGEPTSMVQYMDS